MSDPILGKLATTSSRLLAMAVALVDSAQKVREHMNFAEAEIIAVLDGQRELSWAELDLLATLLIREQGNMITQNRELIELIRLRATRSP